MKTISFPDMSRLMALRQRVQGLADEIPAGTFRKEGTEVATCLFLIIKP